MTLLVVLASFILWKSRFSKPRKLLVFMATQDMVDFHCELFDRCINHSDEQEDTNANDANLKMSKDAKDVMEAVKKVHIKAHSLSKKFCTMIPFSKNDSSG